MPAQRRVDGGEPALRGLRLIVACRAVESVGCAERGGIAAIGRVAGLQLAPERGHALLDPRRLTALLLGRRAAAKAASVSRFDRALNGAAAHTERGIGRAQAGQLVHQQP